LKVSIITITYNAEKYLERTIKSIISQTSDQYEYLIIDGGSKDSTLAIADKYREHIDYLVSEPDKGLYDAMNKGLQAATGDYVWFMNAGDEIYDNTVLERMVKLMPENADVFYGETMFVDEEGKEEGLRSLVTPHKLPEKLHWKSLKLGMVVCHQAFIARKSIAPLFDLNHRYSADVDWEIKCLKNAKKTVKIKGIVAKYLTGGFSKIHHRKSLEDRYKVLEKHYGKVPNALNHLVITFRAGLHKLFSK
jgi:glycosyltransferase involved in cell wall biosynthesis